MIRMQCRTAEFASLPAARVFFSAFWTFHICTSELHYRGFFKVIVLELRLYRYHKNSACDRSSFYNTINPVIKKCYNDCVF